MFTRSQVAVCTTIVIESPLSELSENKRLNMATCHLLSARRQPDLTRGRKRKTEFCRKPLRAAINLHRQTRTGLDQLDLCTNHSPIRVSFLCLLVDSSHLQDRHSNGQIQLRSFHAIMVLNPRLGHRFDLNYYWVKSNVISTEIILHTVWWCITLSRKLSGFWTKMRPAYNLVDWNW